MPEWLETFVPAAPARLDREQFREALRTTPRRASPANSGLRYEHLKDLCLEDEELFELLFAICCIIAEGRISRRVAVMLTTGRLFAMAKLRVGGVRPIAVGQTLLRLSGRWLARQFREEFQTILAPFQFGVATRGGCEAVVHGVRAYLELHPGHVAVQTDVENAFNRVYRSAIFEELRDRMPHLLPFVRATYGFDGQLVYRRARGPVFLSSAAGVRQGDPLSMPLFALAAARVLRGTAEMVPRVLPVAVADDVTLLGPPAEAAAAFEVLSTGLEEIGCPIRLGKCAVWGPSGVPDDLGLPAEVRRPAEGSEILGAPVGSEAFVISARLEIHVQHLDTLPQLRDSQVTLPMLTRCIAQRSSYLARVVAPTPAVLESFRSQDGRLMGGFAGIVEYPALLEPSQTLARSQALLPISFGGVGLRSLAATAPAAFVGA